MYTIVDVSNNNGGAIDWHRVKASGITGVLLKATEGITFNDATYDPRSKAARAVGMRVGAYHFAHPENDPVMEAAHFCRAVGKLGRWDFKPVLDFEYGHPDPKMVVWIQKFNTVVKQRLGSYPIFYSYPYYIEGLKLAKPVGNGLWLASYDRNTGADYGAAVPAPWKKWNLHQFTSNGTVGGIEGHVDLSHASSLLGLLAHPLLGATTPKPAV